MTKIQINWSTFWGTREKKEMQTLPNLCNSCVLGDQLKSKLQHTRTWSHAAWLLCHLCYHSAVFFRYLYRHVLSFPQGNIQHAFKEMLLLYFFLILCKNWISCAVSVTDSCELCFYMLCYSCLKQSDQAVCEHNLALHGMWCSHYVSIMQTVLCTNSKYNRPLKKKTAKKVAKQ